MLYGDIRPIGDGIRLLATIRLAPGQLLLQLGFARTMRSGRPGRPQGDSGRRREAGEHDSVGSRKGHDPLGRKRGQDAPPRREVAGD
jgi:hypothetical protein